MNSQGSFPEGGRGNASTSSKHDTTAAGCSPPEPPLPLDEELEEDPFPPAPLEELELDVLVFCGLSSEHPHKQAIAVISKSQRFITAPFLTSNEPRFRHWPSHRRPLTR